MPAAAVIRLATAAAPVVAFEDVTLAMGGRTLLDRKLDDEPRAGTVTVLDPDPAFVQPHVLRHEREAEPAS